MSGIEGMLIAGTIYIYDQLTPIAIVAFWQWTQSQTKFLYFKILTNNNKVKIICVYFISS